MTEVAPSVSASGLGAVLLVLYLIGALVALVVIDAPPLARLGLAAFWPIGPIAFVLTITVLLLASLIAFPLIGAIVVLAALTAAVVLAEPVRQERATPAGLQRLLDAELARFPARTGIYVKHLTTGEEAAVRGNETFNSASVIKLPIMALAYQLADRGELSLDARVPLRKSDFRAGSGVLRYHDPGLQPTVRDLITQMIITSDNTATDMVLAQVGGVAKVNAWLDANGYTDLRLNATLFEVFRRRYAFAEPSLATLTPEELYAIQTGDASFAGMAAERFESIRNTMGRPGVADELTRQVNEEPATWLGRITPSGTGRLLERFEACTGASPSSCGEMTGALRRQQAGARRLPHFLDVPVAHKTGDFPPVLANDVGIVYARSGPIVVAFLTNAISGPYAETEDRMGRTARAIVDYFDGGPGGHSPKPRAFRGL